MNIWVSYETRVLRGVNIPFTASFSSLKYRCNSGNLRSCLSASEQILFSIHHRWLAQVARLNWAALHMERSSHPHHPHLPHPCPWLGLAAPLSSAPPGVEGLEFILFQEGKAPAEGLSSCWPKGQNCTENCWGWRDQLPWTAGRGWQELPCTRVGHRQAPLHSTDQTKPNAWGHGGSH